MKLEYTDTSQNILTIGLEGDMDALGCNQVRPSLEKIINTQNNKVLLDLTQVRFLDSSGIGVIVFLYKRLKAKGRALEIINVQGQPQEFMDLLRIGKAIPVSTHSNSQPLHEGEECIS